MAPVDPDTIRVMPAEDPGDIFLQHRGLVLEALLADPSFDQPPAAGGDPDPDLPLPDVERFNNPSIG